MVLSAVLIGIAAAAFADIDLPTRDSSRFDFKYEMDVLPTDADLDGDGYKDFTGGGDWLTLKGNGIAQFDMRGESNRYIQSTTAAGQDGCVWRRYAPTAETGYTIEVRMRVIEQGSGKTAAAAVTASEGSNYDSMLTLTTSALKWGSDTGTAIANFIANFATTNSFHTYRIAKLPSENRFVLWCDANLVTSSLNDALGNTGLNRLLLGAIGGSYRSLAEVDYLRFTKGAYAPKPSRGVDSAQFPHRYEMDLSDTRFSPTGNATDWQHFVGTNGTSVLSEGILSVDQPKGVMRYWQTYGAMDETAVKGSSFTFEVRLRLNEAWEGATENDVINFMIGIPGTSCLFNLGKNRVGWRVGNSWNTVYSADNTDTMHIFRVTQCVGVFTLWRDGVKICENLSPFGDEGSYVRFGMTSNAGHGGSFDLDYVRWTTEGAFQPYVQPPGLKIIIF